VTTGPVNLAPLEGAKDWRLPENRREAFLDFYAFSLETQSFPGMVYSLIPYLRNHYGWNEEQTLWFAFLNGNTQHPVSTWLMHKRGSRPEEAREVLAYYYDNRGRLGWDTDRRYYRRALEQAVLGFVGLLQGRTQGEYWRGAAVRGWPGIWAAATAIPTFGRLSAWSLCDYLHIAGIDFEPDTLFLEDRDGSRSHRNGLAIVSGLDVYDWHQSNHFFDGHYPRRLTDHLGSVAEGLLDESRVRAGNAWWARDVSLLTLESALCTYKSFHRPNRRYPGVYADMLYDRIKGSEEAFPEEDFAVFWKARRDTLPAYLRLENMPGDPGLSSVKQNHYIRTGEIPVMGRWREKYWSAFDAAVDDEAWTRDEPAAEWMQGLA
jgi:hypothetical protein